MQRSAQNYSSMLARASALLGMQPERVELIEALPNGPGKAQLSGEVSVAQELQERMKLRMQVLQRLRESHAMHCRMNFLSVWRKLCIVRLPRISKPMATDATHVQKPTSLFMTMHCFAVVLVISQCHMCAPESLFPFMA